MVRFLSRAGAGLRRRGVSRSVIAFGVLALALFCTAWVWSTANDITHLRALARFDLRVQQVTDAIRARLEQYDGVLHGFQALYAASKSVERDEFRAYADCVSLDEFPGLVAVAFVAHLPSDGLAQFVELTREDGAPEFVVTPLGQRDVYAPIKYREPPSSVDWSLGADLLALGVLRPQLQTSRDSGETVLTPLVRTLGASRPDVLLLLPVYRNGQPHETPDQRRAGHEGWIVGVLHVDSIVAEEVTKGLVTLELFDGNSAEPSARLARAGTASAPRAGLGAEPTRHVPMDLYGRIWTCRFTGTPRLITTEDRRGSLIVLATGAVMSLLLFAVVHSLVTTRDRAVALATQMTASLRDAQRRAEDATRAKSEFLANMSHEIRTPMTAILGFGDLLVETEGQPSERLNAINIIRRNGQHLLTLINDILDLSKIEAGRLEVERTACSPCRLLVDVADLLNDRAREKNLTLSVEILNPIPERIESDPMRLKQAVLNVVGNAIKFTTRGGVTVKLACARQEEKLTFHVADTGCGIAREQLDHLFQPFVQADVSTTRRFGGTGLGLAISKSLAHLLGGDLTVISRAGAGSEFRLTVATGPLEGVQLITSLDPLRTSIEPAVSSQSLPSLCGRVLLVEDGPDNQRLISAILRRAGGEVTVAAHGQDGVEAALQARDQGTPYDLILMDMQMPVMDGYTATRVLREHGYAGQIVALTAHAMKGELEKCLDAGCDHYLSKPISRDVLLREVDQRMGKLSDRLPARAATPT
jgi:signal transduction histidine kinase/ActR/RegA family two-component response regulator